MEATPTSIDATPLPRGYVVFCTGNVVEIILVVVPECSIGITVPTGSVVDRLPLLVSEMESFVGVFRGYEVRSSIGRVVFRFKSMGFSSKTVERDETITLVFLIELKVAEFVGSLLDIVDVRVFAVILVDGTLNVDAGMVVNSFLSSSRTTGIVVEREAE